MPKPIPRPENPPLVMWIVPECDACDRAVALFEGLGWVTVKKRPYLEEPPTRQELIEVLAKMDAPPARILRAKEAAEQGLDPATATDEALLDAMSADPRLIDRPIVVRGGRAALARPGYRGLEVLMPEGELPPIHELMKSDVKDVGI